MKGGGEVYRLTLAGVTIDCRFEFADTPRCFGGYVSGPYPEGECAVALSEACRRGFLEENAFNEYSTFALAVSDRLLTQGRCVMHAAAFRFRNRAYLICAPSGVGKSTQMKTLTELYPGEFSVISGDRPVLEATENGIIVHPSPWNGKEGWCGAGKAKLAAIILLKRGEQSDLQMLKPRSCAARIYSSIFNSAEDEESIRRTAAFAELLLKQTPVWEFINGGVPNSTRLLYEKVLREAEDYGV